MIKLKHIRVDREDISSKLPPRITNNAVIKYDKEHNSIIIIGSIDIVTEAEEFISYLDVPIPQVLIEALVVDFNINKIRSYGMSVFTQSEGDSSGTWDSESFLPTLDLKPGVEKVENALNNVLEVFGAKKSIVDLPKNFRMAINALEASDVVKVRGTPQVATISGNPASITIGETRYYKLTKETKSAYDKEENVIGVDERFEKKQFNTKLSVTPWVMDSGYVMVKITPDFKVPRSGGSSDKPPTVDNRSLESIVRLKDGQTIVLGGQRQTQEMVNSKGVPLLSSIPVLGYLFSSKTITKNETQMMIFVTPHVYYGDEGGVSPDDYFGDEIEELLDDEKEDSKRESRGLFGRIRKNREEREKSERREMGESRDDEEK